MKNKLSFTSACTLVLLVSLGLIVLCGSDKMLSTTSAADANPWTTKAPMPTARNSPMTGVINGLLYVVGGYTGATQTTYFRVLEVYNPATNTWTAKTPMPSARVEAAAGVIDGKLYVAGGAIQVGSNVQTTNILEVYDPATDTWSSKVPMPTGREALAGAVIDGKLYVVGGSPSRAFAPTNILEVYDPATDTWSVKAPMPTSRGYHKVKAINGKLYAIGGRDLNGIALLNNLEVYDPVTNTWETKSPMPTRRDIFGSGVINGRLYAVGGEPNSNPTQTSANESYDPATDTWRTEPPMLTARWGTGVEVINNILYAVGGAISPGTVVQTVNEAFSPPRDLSAISGAGSPGGTATVPIALVSQGNENAVGFSLTYNTAVLSNPQVSLGSDANGANLNSNTSQTAQGRLGIAISLPTGQTFAAEVRQIATVTFTVAASTAGTTTPIGFGDQPIRREIVDTGANPLSSTYTAGIVTITPGYEADVSPRPNGNNNGTATIADWVQVGRFAAGVDTAAAGGEFQRADCAPKGTLGDGRITIADWVQAGRYAVGVDTVVAAGGPTTPTSGLQLAEGVESVAEEGQQARAIRAVNANIERGQNGALVLELDAQGNENALGFSLSFDPAQLRFVSANVGSGAGNASLNVNTSQAASGRVGIAIALPTSQTFAAGAEQILIVTFAALSGGSGTTTTVVIGDQPVGREIVDAAANSLNANWAAATVNLARSVASVSAASFNGDVLSAESIVAAFGNNLSTSVQIANALPLPTLLAGTSVKVKDSGGVERLAPLFFVAPTQVNLLIPANTAAGDATVTITGGDGAVSVGRARIALVAPGLFSANASGQGVVAGDVLRVRADGAQVYETLSRYDAAQQRFVAAPIDLGPEGEQVFLILYGTGWRYRSSLTGVATKIGGATAETLYAGPQGSFVGLDQLNVRLPRSLAGRGEVDIVLTVDSVSANVVRVSVK